MREVQQGDTVTVHYEARLEDGQVLGSSKGEDPLRFTAGGEDVIPGVSGAVVGMKEGEIRTVKVGPSDAYGEHRSELVKSVPRHLLPDDVKVGDLLAATTEGQEFEVRVRELSEGEAVVDANHPLAGQQLEFELTLVTID